MSNRRLYRILIAWAILIAVSALLGRTVIASDNGAAAADFLNIGVGARATALGGAFTSVADDATASYWNPAGLTSVETIQLAFSHFAWYQDITYEYLAAAYPASNRFAFAVSASYLSYGTIEGYDINDEPTGPLSSVYDMAVGISAGYSATENLSVGLTSKYIILSLAEVSASAVAADIGINYHRNNLNAGLSLVNLGQKLKFNDSEDNLPLAIRAGVSGYPFSSSILTTFELENQFYGDFSIKNGIEYNYESRYFVRTGYAFHPGQSGREFGQSFSLGVGALLGPARFDYTFSPQEKYSSESIHRFAVLLEL